MRSSSKARNFTAMPLAILAMQSSGREGPSVTL